MPPKITIDLTKLPQDAAERILLAIDAAAKFGRLKNMDFRPAFSSMAQKVIDSHTRVLKKIERQCIAAVEEMRNPSEKDLTTKGK